MIVSHLSPLVASVPTLLFIVLRIVLGVVAMASSGRVAPTRRTSAVLGGALVALSGLGDGVLHVLNVTGALFPLVHSPLHSVLFAVPGLILAAGVIALVVAATPAPDPHRPQQTPRH
ncbi:hypothetical protein PWG71_25060 [Nocardiopsis sp. N85]|uniref:hypothetical protein n=1 Tax=Nocardiopsis sp. N85 TaxID=3029400 RepID=UPI00237EFED2|nr:hypothetical protein [Nocardiopsis sp. N85]MDE3724672.1 hypothetical protein [Nocardiopsis sp. N85]